MATPAGRPTYGGWLDEIAREGRTDDYGRVATGWANAQANGRPKIHAPRSVNKWLSEHPPPGVANLALTLHQLEQHYHNQSGLPDTPGMVPAQPQPAAGQQPAQATDQAQQDWFSSPAGQQWLASPDGQAWIAQQQAQPADEDVSAGQDDPTMAEWLETDQGQQWLATEDGQAWLTSEDGSAWYAERHQQPEQAADVQVPEHPYQVILLAIGRMEARQEAMMQALAPLIALSGEAMAVDTAIQASAAFQPTPAQARAQAIAREQGWTTGPEIPQQPAAQPGLVPPSFYGQHVVPQPDFGRIADQQDPE